MILAKELTERPSVQEILDHPWMRQVDKVMDLTEPYDHTEF